MNSSDKERLKVLCVCLAYYNHAEVRSYVAKVLKQFMAVDLQVVVVENTPGHSYKDNGWLFAADEEWSNNVRVVGAGENLGYFGGMRFGVNAASEFYEKFDWVILSNTDIDFISEGVPDVFYTSEENLAVVAVGVVSSVSGNDQNPMYISRPSRLKFKVLGFVYRFYVLAVLQRMVSILKRKIRPAVGHGLSGLDSIYAAHGSFICISRSFFERGGSLDYPQFLFCEEIFLAEEVRRLGMRVKYDPRFSVRHSEHAVTGVFPSRHMAKYLAASHQYCASVLLK